MLLSQFVAILGTIALRANPSPNAIPARIDPAPVAASFTPPAVPQAPAAPKKIRTDSLGIETTAPSAIVVDVGSGAVLYAKDANEKRPIASLTKLVASMVVVDGKQLDGPPLVIAPEDIESEGSHVFNAGDVVDRHDALNALLTGSLNELANAFARAYPGGRLAFIAAMNVKAEALGLDVAAFTDPSGIEKENVASALDVARVFRSAIAYPDIRTASSMGGLTVKTGNRSVRVKSTNLLIGSMLTKSPYKLVAAKTGSLPEAGFCFGQVTQNDKGNQIIAVVLGSENHFGRFQEVKALTAWAFDSYAWE